MIIKIYFINTLKLIEFRGMMASRYFLLLYLNKFILTFYRINYIKLNYIVKNSNINTILIHLLEAFSFLKFFMEDAFLFINFMKFCNHYFYYIKWQSFISDTKIYSLLMKILQRNRLLIRPHLNNNLKNVCNLLKLKTI